MAKIPAGVGPRFPQVVVLVGATGDLAKRKLLPGLAHLINAGFIPGCRIIGVSLDDIDVEGFRALVRKALDDHSNRKVADAAWMEFAACLDYVPVLIILMQPLRINVKIHSPLVLQELVLLL